jgi:chromate transporter
MSLLVLYLLLAKAALISFSGSGTIPVVRHDFVERYQVLTDRQLNAAIAAGRTAPGPNGLYVISVGYFVGGLAGGCAALLAVVTPAFLIIPMLRFLGRRADRPEVKSAIRAVTLAGGGLILTNTVPLARDALTGILPLVIAVGSFLFLVLTGRATIWVILGAAVVGLAGRLITG